MEQLTRDDVTILCEALEAWERKDTAGNMLGMLIGGMFTKDDPIARAKFETEEKQRNERAAREERARKDRSVILRAKLLQMHAADSMVEMERAVNAAR